MIQSFKVFNSKLDIIDFMIFRSDERQMYTVTFDVQSSQLTAPNCTQSAVYYLFNCREISVIDTSKIYSTYLQN